MEIIVPTHAHIYMFVDLSYIYITMSVGVRAHLNENNEQKFSLRCIKIFGNLQKFKKDDFKLVLIGSIWLKIFEILDLEPFNINQNFK